MLENKWLLRKHQLNKSSKAFVWFLLEVTPTQAIWSVFNTSVNHRYIILEDMLKGKSLQKRKYLKITLQHLAHTCKSTFYSDNFRTPWAVFGFCIFLFQTISTTKLIYFEPFLCTTHTWSNNWEDWLITLAFSPLAVCEPVSLCVAMTLRRLASSLSSVYKVSSLRAWTHLYSRCVWKSCLCRGVTYQVLSK